MTKNAIIALTGYLAISVLIANPTYGIVSECLENFSTISDTSITSDDSLRVTVYVTFIVDKKGKVKNIELLKTECDSCDSEIKNNCEKEAIRVVSEMPRWTPAKTEGKRQEQRYNLPIRFTLPKEVYNEENE